MSTRRRHHHLTRRQKITLKMKRKLALLFVVIVLILVGIIVRLVYINRVSGEQYTKKSSCTAGYQQYDTSLQTRRYL